MADLHGDVSVRCGHKRRTEVWQSEQSSGLVSKRVTDSSPLRMEGKISSSTFQISSVRDSETSKTDRQSSMTPPRDRRAQKPRTFVPSDL